MVQDVTVQFNWIHKFKSFISHCKWKVARRCDNIKERAECGSDGRESRDSFTLEKGSWSSFIPCLAVSLNVNIYFYCFISRRGNSIQARLGCFGIYWIIWEFSSIQWIFHLVSKLLEIKLYWYHCFCAVSFSMWFEIVCLLLHTTARERRDKKWLKISIKKSDLDAGHFFFSSNSMGKSLMTSELFFA